MKRYLLLLTMACCSAAQAQTIAPFGIVEGTTIQQLKAMGAVYSEKYKTWRLDKVPTPNAAFEYYTVKATEKTGVCRVSGIGLTITTTSDGSAIKDQFNKLKTALNNKYGASKDFDFLHSNSIWTGDTYWMRGLEQDERSLDSFWDIDSGSTIPKSIEAISLYASALSSTEGFINLSYEFDNYPSCKAESDKSNGDGL